MKSNISRVVAALFLFSAVSAVCQLPVTPPTAHFEPIVVKNQKTEIKGIVFDETSEVENVFTDPVIACTWKIKSTSSAPITFYYRVSTEEDFELITLNPGGSISETRKVGYSEAGTLVLEVKPGTLTKAEIKKLTKKTLAASKALTDLAGKSKLRKKAQEIENDLAEIRGAVVQYPLIKIKNVEAAEDLVDILMKKSTPVGIQKKTIKKLISQITVIHSATSKL